MKYTGKYGIFLFEQYDGELWGKCKECEKDYPVEQLRDISVLILGRYHFVCAACENCIKDHWDIPETPTAVCRRKIYEEYKMKQEDDKNDQNSM